MKSISAGLKNVFVQDNFLYKTATRIQSSSATPPHTKIALDLYIDKHGDYLLINSCFCDLDKEDQRNWTLINYSMIFPAYYDEEKKEVYIKLSHMGSANGMKRRIKVECGIALKKKCYIINSDDWDKKSGQNQKNKGILQEVLLRPQTTPEIFITKA